MKNSGIRLLLAGLPILLGLLFIVFGVRNNLRGMTSLTWPSVEGRITSLDRNQGRKARYHVFYAYEVGGVAYNNSRVNFQDDKASKREIYQNQKEGDRVTVHYDPADPGQSVLQPGAPFSALVMKLVAGLFCHALGLFLWRYTGRAKAPAPGASAS